MMRRKQKRNSVYGVCLFMLGAAFLSFFSPGKVHGGTLEISSPTSLTRVGDRVLVGTRGFGVFEFLPAEERLTPLSDGLEFIYPLSHFSVTSLISNPANSSIFFAGINHGYLAWSVDGGSRWNHRATLLGVSEITVLATHPYDGNRLYCGTDRGIFTSRDGGLTWLKSDNGRFRIPIGDIAIDPVNPDFVYAVGYEAGVTERGWLLTTQNGGQSWSIREMPCPLNKVLIDLLDHAIVYVANVGIGQTSGRCPLVSTDYGYHFTMFSPDLGERRMNDLAVSPSGVLFVATDRGIFIYDSQRGSWVDTGITEEPVLHLLIAGTLCYYSTAESFGWNSCEE